MTWMFKNDRMFEADTLLSISFLIEVLTSSAFECSFDFIFSYFIDGSF